MSFSQKYHTSNIEGLADILNSFEERLSKIEADPVAILGGPNVKVIQSGNQFTISSEGEDNEQVVDAGHPWKIITGLDGTGHAVFRVQEGSHAGSMGTGLSNVTISNVATPWYECEDGSGNDEETCKASGGKWKKKYHWISTEQALPEIFDLLVLELAYEYGHISNTFGWPYEYQTDTNENAMGRLVFMNQEELDQGQGTKGLFEVSGSGGIHGYDLKYIRIPIAGIKVEYRDVVIDETTVSRRRIKEIVQYRNTNCFLWPCGLDGVHGEYVFV